MLRGYVAMKKIRAALAAGVALSTIAVAAPAFAQFGALGALAAARANSGRANTATAAAATATFNAARGQVGRRLTGAGASSITPGSRRSAPRRTSVRR